VRVLYSTAPVASCTLLDVPLAAGGVPFRACRCFPWQSLREKGAQAPGHGPPQSAASDHRLAKTPSFLFLSSFFFFFFFLFGGAGVLALQFVERRYSREQVALLLDSELRADPGRSRPWTSFHVIEECLQKDPEPGPPSALWLAFWLSGCLRRLW